MLRTGASATEMNALLPVPDHEALNISFGDELLPYSLLLTSHLILLSLLLEEEPHIQYGKLEQLHVAAAVIVDPSACAPLIR